MREVSEITNGRVAWYSIMSIGVCIAVSVMQVFHLKRYFRKKKLIQIFSQPPYNRTMQHQETKEIMHIQRFRQSDLTRPLLHNSPVSCLRHTTILPDEQTLVKKGNLVIVLCGTHYSQSSYLIFFVSVWMHSIFQLCHHTSWKGFLFSFCLIVLQKLFISCKSTLQIIIRQSLIGVLVTIGLNSNQDFGKSMMFYVKCVSIMWHLVAVLCS